MGITKLETQNLNDDVITSSKTTGVSVNSTKINAAITNDDISPSASLATTKLDLSSIPSSQFVQMMSPRDLSSMKVGQCKYVILTNQKGGILNDPILLKLDDDRYWFSLADSDVLF